MFCFHLESSRHIDSDNRPPEAHLLSSVLVTPDREGGARHVARVGVGSAPSRVLIKIIHLSPCDPGQPLQFPAFLCDTLTPVLLWHPVTSSSPCRNWPSALQPLPCRVPALTQATVSGSAAGQGHGLREHCHQSERDSWDCSTWPHVSRGSLGRGRNPWERGDEHCGDLLQQRAQGTITFSLCGVV